MAKKGFNRIIIHYPEKEGALGEIDKTMAACWGKAASNYIKGLELCKWELEELYTCLAKTVKLKRSEEAALKEKPSHVAIELKQPFFSDGISHKAANMNTMG